MNPTLILTLWRQRLLSAVRMAIVAMLCGFPMLAALFAPAAGLTPLGNAQGLMLALGAGMIGQDVSSGVLQLLCARPVKRSEYVLSRWLGVALAGIAISLVQLGIASALLAARGYAPAPQQMALFAATRTLECLGLSAVLALLSSLIGGFGDLALYLIAGLAGGVLSMTAQVKHWMWLDRIASQLTSSLTPTIDLHRLLTATPLQWFPIVSYASTVTLCLAVAIVIVNRKELSYASG